MLDVFRYWYLVLRACARACERGQVIMLAVAKCDRLAAVPQLLLSFELFLQNTKASKTISNKVRRQSHGSVRP